MLTKTRTLAFSLTLGLISAASAHAACPTAPFYIDLKSGAAGTINGSNAQVTLASPVTASPVAGCAGWKEAVLKINLAGCTKATLLGEWEGVPKDWTLNIGDSPTDDGFAGDAGTTTNDAELWILQEAMSIADNGAAPNNPIYKQDLSLTDSSLKFVVKNQFISWGQPYGFLQTPSTKQLFAFPDTNNVAEGSNFYAGLNRVVFNAPANGRRGCGLRRMLVILQ
jgi:hypothetical protein